MRLRLRAAANLATRVVFSNSATAAEHLAHEDRSRAVLDEVCGRRRRDEGDSLRLEHVVTRELHHEVASEAVGAFDKDRPRAVAQEPLKHLGEAGPAVDRVRAALTPPKISGNPKGNFPEGFWLCVMHKVRQ